MKRRHCVFILDYDYDYYGITDYRGGYSEPYYDELYNEYPYDYPPSSATSGATTTTTGGSSIQRTARNISVGSSSTIHKKLHLFLMHNLCTFYYFIFSRFCFSFIILFDYLLFFNNWHEC